VCCGLFDHEYRESFRVGAVNYRFYLGLKRVMSYHEKSFDNFHPSAKLSSENGCCHI
jgi:hypothetical protein